MYCFGSTITCTQFPKFSLNGKPQILPRPYFSSKPSQAGYNIIRTEWMQSFLSNVEFQVLHYLHNICEDKKLSKKLYFTLLYQET